MSARLLAAIALAVAAIATRAIAQTQTIPVELPTVYVPPEAQPAADTLPPARLDQLVAPIALYPDPLLTDILAASTYPAQIAEAQRFATVHQDLQGAALADAAASHHWDPSIQALLAFPQVLRQLDSNLEWTDRLGQAFIAQQADVLNAIQRLRQRAEAAGTLTSTPQDEVVNEGGDIAILPPSDQQVYVPSYDAACVYGPFAGCGDEGVAWGDALWLPFGYLPWGVLDWGHRRIDYTGLHGGAAGHHGGWEAHGGIWHHAGATHLAFGRAPAEIGSPGQFQPGAGQIGSLAQGQSPLDHFNYAPPAGERLGQGSFNARPIMPRPIAPAGLGRGPEFHSGGFTGHAVHAAPAPVQGGFGHR